MHRVLVASSRGQDAATVRYVGPVGGEGVWAGVQFDAAGRGKHSGTHEGISYFDAPPASLYIYAYVGRACRA